MLGSARNFITDTWFFHRRAVLAAALVFAVAGVSAFAVLGRAPTARPAPQTGVAHHGVRAQSRPGPVVPGQSAIPNLPGLPGGPVPAPSQKPVKETYKPLAGGCSAAEAEFTKFTSTYPSSRVLNFAQRTEETAVVEEVRASCDTGQYSSFEAGAYAAYQRT